MGLLEEEFWHDEWVKALRKIAELERDRRELLRVIEAVKPTLDDLECACSDNGLCDRHLVDVTLANFKQ